jgi:SNF2 family DNA or RNA helicase
MAAAEARMMDYISQRQPRAKQAEALTRIQGQEAFALQMEMRTGKTKVVIDDFGRLESSGDVNDLVVIAPAGAYRPWWNEILADASSDLLRRCKVHIWAARDKSKAKQEQLKAFLAFEGPRILLMNVEALSTVKSAQDVLLKFVSARKCMGVIDESTTIRNPDSKRTKFILQKIAPRLQYRRILTGLIAPKSPLDLYCQFEFLDKQILGHQTFTTFKARYAIEEKVCLLPQGVLASRLERAIGTKPFVMNGMGVVTVRDLPRNIIMRELDRRNIWYQSFKKIVGFQHEDELYAKTAPFSYRCKLEDCYDLPPKIYMRRDVEMTDEQRRIYANLLDYYTAELDGMEHVTASNVISRMIRLHQVLCGHTKSDETGEEIDIASHRPARLMELLEDHTGKAIIWCSYDHDVRKLAKLLQESYGENSVARFWGGNIATREDEEKLFLTDPACQYMLATPAAGGRGRTWVNADLVAYYSNTHDLEHRLQSEMRAQGVDKVNSVAYVDFITPDTVEEKILHCLRNKLTMASVVSGDDFRQWLI